MTSPPLPPHLVLALADEGRVRRGLEVRGGPCAIPSSRAALSPLRAASTWKQLEYGRERSSGNGARERGCTSCRKQTKERLALFKNNPKEGLGLVLSELHFPLHLLQLRLGFLVCRAFLSQHNPHSHSREV